MVQFVNTFFLIVALISALLVVDVHNRNQVEANTLEKLKKESIEMDKEKTNLESKISKMTTTEQMKIIARQRGLSQPNPMNIKVISKEK